VCHQSVGLIARHVEGLGIPTLSMTSALSITRSVDPPRAAYLDFPLGHTAGKPGDHAGNLAILRDALRVFEEAKVPGEVVLLDYEWAEDDDWKDRVMRPHPKDAADGEHQDDRIARHSTPQYQSAEDARLAEAAGECRTCVSVEPEDA